jgi:hypothetical protein
MREFQFIHLVVCCVSFRGFNFVCVFVSGLLLFDVLDFYYVLQVFNMTSNIFLEVVIIHTIMLPKSKTTLHPFQLYLVYYQILLVQMIMLIIILNTKIQT